jgi:uncharacterized protein YggE
MARANTTSKRNLFPTFFFAIVVAILAILFIGYIGMNVARIQTSFAAASTNKGATPSENGGAIPSMNEGVIQTISTISNASITVSASGSVTSDPDEALIYLFLNSTGSSFSSAVENLSSVAEMLNSTLMPLLGGNASLIRTLYYKVYTPPSCVNVTPYYYPKPYYCIQPLSPKIYVASEYLLVTLPNVSNVNQALMDISKITGIGISDVSSMLSSQKQMIMMQEALAFAMDNATSQAQAVAGSGVQLKTQNISITSGYLVYPYLASGEGALASTALYSGNQTFFPGTATITKNVNVVFRTT